jgi:hypothetical protein
MNNKDSQLLVATIHDMEPRGFLAFDLIDILNCFGSTIHGYEWTVTGLDCTGTEAQLLCDQLEKAGELGAHLTTEELQTAARNFGQTIEGTFVGVPAQGIKDQVVIRAVDSSYFEVTTRDPQKLAALQTCFKDVRRRDLLGIADRKG